VKDVTDLVVLARVSGSLFVVLLVAVLAARLARRAGRRSGRGGIAVRERVGLTRDTSAVVLEVGDRVLLLGVGPQQVNLLAELGPGAAARAVQSLPVQSLPGRSVSVAPVAALPAAPTMPAPVPWAQGAQTSPAARSEQPAWEAMVPAQRSAAGPSEQASVRVVTGMPAAQPLTRRELREAGIRRAVPPTRRGNGSVLDPRTWQQGVEALRDLTARRG